MIMFEYEERMAGAKALLLYNITRDLSKTFDVIITLSFAKTKLDIKF